MYLQGTPSEVIIESGYHPKIRNDNDMATRLDRPQHSPNKVTHMWRADHNEIDYNRTATSSNIGDSAMV